MTSAKGLMLFGHQEKDLKSLEEMITYIQKGISTRDQMQCGPLEKEQMLSREETIFFLKMTSPKDQMLFGHQERDPKS